MNESHWTPAIQSLNESSTGIYGPESFRDYLENTGEDPRNYRTAAEISIDTKRDLAPELRQNETMVLRLGSAPEGVGTQFGLVKTEDNLNDFFINESDFNSRTQTRLDYSPDGEDIELLGRNARDMLNAYRILPNFSETTLVNLALSTGVLSQALNLDVEKIGIAPTTIASTFDFEFEPHSSHPTVVHHNNGQVEIDSIVTTRRENKRVLLVVEAKIGRKRSLAKHKLFYPYMAIEGSSSELVDEIIPVYLHATKTSQGFQYDIYECTVPLSDGGKPILSDLQVVSNEEYLIKIE